MNVPIDTNLFCGDNKHEQNAWLLIVELAKFLEKIRKNILLLYFVNFGSTIIIDKCIIKNFDNKNY